MGMMKLARSANFIIPMTARYVSPPVNLKVNSAISRVTVIN